MKGIELEMMFVILIALVGISLLLLFVSGPLRDMGTSILCFFYQNVLHKPTEFCEAKGNASETIELKPSTTEELARYIAVYSIKCWKNVEFQKEKSILCSSIELKSNPGPVSEFDVTKIMEDEGGCPILENSIIKDISGNEMDYPGKCGTKDRIGWEVSGNVLDKQSLILIKYDKSSNKIIIRA
ncbi:MAG: hypothetical protein QXQ40_02590 [Candidatus Aenigmatarchaeota archaeon]